MQIVHQNVGLENGAKHVFFSFHFHTPNRYVSSILTTRNSVFRFVKVPNGTISRTTSPLCSHIRDSVVAEIQKIFEDPSSKRVLWAPDRQRIGHPLITRVLWLPNHACSGAPLPIAIDHRSLNKLAKSEKWEKPMEVLMGVRIWDQQMSYLGPAFLMFPFPLKFQSSIPTVSLVSIHVLTSFPWHRACQVKSQEPHKSK